MLAKRLLRLSWIGLALLVAAALSVGGAGTPPSQPGSALAQAAPLYTVTGLGDLPGGPTFSKAYGISDSGKVVGSTDIGFRGGKFAFQWEDGTMTLLPGDLYAPRLGWYIASKAFAINDGSQAVGQSQGLRPPLGSFAPDDFDGALWQDDDMVPQDDDMVLLDDDAPDVCWIVWFPWPTAYCRADDSTANDINDSGQIVGEYSRFPTGYWGPRVYRPFIWQAGTLTELSGVPAGNHRARGINDAGHVVGSFGRWISGGVTPLGIDAFDINDSDQIVGVSGGSGYLWEAGGLTDLGDLPGGADQTVPHAINNGGQVVGTSAAAEGDHAFLWDKDNGMRDLNDLIDPAAGWTLTEARDINSSGQIVGWGVGPGGFTEGFVLTAGGLDFEILYARMVSPHELGIDIRVEYPEACPQDAPLDVTLSATINGSEVEKTFDITQLMEPGETKDIRFDDGSELTPARVIDLLTDAVDGEEVPRFEENEFFTLRGVASCEGGPQSSEAEKEVEILLPVLILHGYTYTHTAFGRWVIQPFVFSAYDGLMGFLGDNDNGYTTDDKWYRTLWGPSSGLTYQGHRETPGSIVSKVDGWVDDALEGTYADKVNLVGHSMGGLIAVHYAGETSKVDKVVTVGAPFRGAALFYEEALKEPTKAEADGILRVPDDLPHEGEYNLLRWLEPQYDPESALVYSSGVDATEPFTNSFSPTYKDEVQYYSIYAFGKNTPYQLRVEDSPPDWYENPRVHSEERGDGTVLELSARGPVGDHVAVNDGGGWFLSLHVFLCERKQVKPAVLHALTGKTETASDTMSSAWHSGVVHHSETLSHSMTVEPGAARARFSLSWQGSDLDLVLYGPDGGEINPEVAAGDPNIDFVEGETYEEYAVLDPTPGTWTAEIEGVDVPEGGEDYVLLALSEADITPPTTMISVAPPSPDGANDWYVSPVTVTMAAEDDPGGSGVAWTAYRLEGGPWQAYTGPFTISADGSITVEARSTDDAGNTEDPPVSTTFTIDQVSPAVAIVLPAIDEAVQDGVTLAASASDDASGVADVHLYVRDDTGGTGTPVGHEDLAATYNPGSGNWEYYFDSTQLPDGYHVILARAEDNAGNESWSEVRHFSIRNWAVVELLPASESNRAGRTMPVKFSLRIAEKVDPAQPFVRNEELTIKIYETGSPEDVLQASMFGDTARDYRIDEVGDLYITNFRTLRQPKNYTVEVWRQDFLVGSFTFATVR